MFAAVPCSTDQLNRSFLSCLTCAHSGRGGKPGHAICKSTGNEVEVSSWCSAWIANGSQIGTVQLHVPKRSLLSK